MWKKLSKHNTISILHIGSALLLAAVLVLSAFTTSFVTSASGTRNSPPYAPSNPFPVNKSTNVPIITNLVWTGGDPDNDTVTYNVYFGTNQTPPQVATKITTTLYNPGNMNFSTTYYWRIVAWDNHSQSTPGPLWEFTTTIKANHPPNVPNNPNPGNETKAVSLHTNLSWKGGDPDNDTVFYDLYFGQNTTPSKKAGNLTNTTYTSLGTLSYNTIYYWRIIATDNHSASTNGPLWMFTTEKAPQGNVSVTITKPVNNSFYFQDVRHNLSGRTIVYGSITITASASSPAGIARVDFYIDGKLVGNATTEPYTYFWKISIQLSLKHTIKVVAIDKDGKNASAEITVTRWRFHVLPVIIIGAALLSSAISHTTMTGLVFNLKENGRGYTFFAIHMHFHSVGLLKNEHGIITMKQCTARFVIGPMTIFRLGPPRTFAYISITFLGGIRIPSNTGQGLLQSLLQSRSQGKAKGSSNR